MKAWKRLRCWVRRKLGGRHLYRKGVAWCDLCGHPKPIRKGAK